MTDSRESAGGVPLFEGGDALRQRLNLLGQLGNFVAYAGLGRRVDLALEQLHEVPVGKLETAGDRTKRPGREAPAPLL